MASSRARRAFAMWLAVGVGAAGPISIQGQASAGLEPVAHVEVGLNPHQIVFSPDGSRAYVAAAGSDRITVLDASTRRVRSSLSIDGTPLGLAVLDGGAALAVTRFGSDRLVRLGARAGAIMEDVEVGGGPSLIVGPLADGTLLVSSEQTDRLSLVDGNTFTVRASVPVGDRPFPPAVTSDGLVALVPGYDDGTVTRVDLPQGEVAWSVFVGARPSGGALLPGDTLYAVAVRGENRLALVDIRTGEVVGEVTDGIGEGPFSVVVSPGLGVGFVNNTASHEVSVLDLTTFEVVERVPVPELPIVMAVGPDERTLWVSSEGEDGLTVFAIPDAYQAAPAVPSQTPPGTDIWVADLIHRNGWYELGPLTRVTDRPGYDNQPHMLSGGRALLYTSIDETGQADIWRADLQTGDLQPVTRTAPESEYSAAMMPGGGAMSVIRVEADSTQRLWRFPFDGTEPSVLMEDVAPVGYQAWADSNRIGVFVLGDPPTLQLVDLAHGQPLVVARRIGRSLHYVPSLRAIAFVQFDDAGAASIRAVDVNTGVSATLTEARPRSQDMAWTPEPAALMAEGSRLYSWTVTGGWRLVDDLGAQGLEGITRLSVSPEGDRIALVAAR